MIYNIDIILILYWYYIRALCFSKDFKGIIHLLIFWTVILSTNLIYYIINCVEEEEAFFSQVSTKGHSLGWFKEALGGVMVET